MNQVQLNHDVDCLKQSLPALPEPVAAPALIVVSGLPGTGKSFFCGRLAEKASFLIIESDAMRKVLFPAPSYSADESARLFMGLHGLVQELLQRGIPIIFDATNLVEHHRERLYRIADKTRAKLVLVSVEAPPEVVYQRLQKRQNDSDPDGKSDADWNIYQRMKPAAGKIQRSHLVVDTERNITPVIDKILRLIRR